MCKSLVMPVGYYMSENVPLWENACNPGKKQILSKDALLRDGGLLRRLRTLKNEKRNYEI
jgi:hypothetical protein